MTRGRKFINFCLDSDWLKRSKRFFSEEHRNFTSLRLNVKWNAKVFQQNNTKLYNNTFGTNYDEAIIDEIGDSQPKNKELGIIPTRREVEIAFKKMEYEISPG